MVTAVWYDATYYTDLVSGVLFMSLMRERTMKINMKNVIIDYTRY